MASIFKCPNCYDEGLPVEEVPCWKCGSRKIYQPQPEATKEQRNGKPATNEAGKAA